MESNGRNINDLSSTNCDDTYKNVAYLSMAVNLCFVIMFCYYFIKVCSTNEYFTSRPSHDQKNKFADEIISNKSYFSSGMYKARNKMPWLDAITYEDIRKLIRSDDFYRESIIDVLN